MQTSSRQTYIDWLRFGAIAAVLFFHSAMPFTDDFWHVKNNQQSQVLTEMVIWLHRFRMPLLFFISGTVSWFMLQKKSAGGFIRLRLMRLFIPLIFGMLVVVPPQVYIERVQSGYTGNFFSFYPTMFTTGPYPKGNLSWHHLWFIAYLLVYDIVFAPVFKYLVSEKGKQLIEKMSVFAKGRRLYWLMLPSLIVYSLLSNRYPQTADLIHDYAYLPYWLFYLLAGFVFIANWKLMESLERNRRLSLALGIFLALFLNAVRWSASGPNDDSNWWIIMRAISVVCAWSSVFAAVGYGRRYLNTRTNFLDYSNQAIYPFYILHQTVMVWLAQYIVRFPDGVAMKYFCLVVTTFAVSMSLYHLVIRPVPVLRFLFGMQALKKEDAARPQDTVLPRRMRLQEEQAIFS